VGVEIKVWSGGESVGEGTRGHWLKPDGAAVQANEPVLEVETDRATQEIVAPAAGTLSIAVKEGEKVSIGTVVGHIDPAGKAAPAKATAQPPKPAAAPAAKAAAPPAKEPQPAPATTA